MRTVVSTSPPVLALLVATSMEVVSVVGEQLSNSTNKPDDKASTFMFLVL
jgi:hypothetical protein